MSMTISGTNKKAQWKERLVKQQPAFREGDTREAISESIAADARAEHSSCIGPGSL